MPASKKNLLSLLYALPLLLALVLFLSAPVKYADCVREGVSLWAVSVLPSVFPFLFLTGFLANTQAFQAFSRRIAPLAQRVFRVSGTGGSIFLLSALSGYPVGARTIADRCEKNAIPKEELFRLSCLCSTTGPVFLVGVVGGGMLKNTSLGWLMLLSHLLAVITVSFLLSLRAPKARLPIANIPSKSSSLGGEVYSSVISVLCVGGSIALFACFSQMTADIFRLPESGLVTALVRGLMEMTTGCALLCREPTRLTLCLCCFLTTFGGLCVLVQQLAFLAPAGVKTLSFVAVKAVQGIVAAALFYPLSFLAL